MKQLNVKSAFLLFAMLFMFACSEDRFQLEHQTLETTVQEISVTPDEEMLVSLENASSVAEAFLSRETKNSVKSLKNASVEILKDNEGNPSMFIVNYPEGGFVIVSATKNYYPVLAYSDKNSFEIQPEMGGVQVWLKEANEAIRVSALLPDSVKASMRAMWKTYEDNDFKAPLASMSKSADPYMDMMNDRINQLHNMYSQSGWMTFKPLAYAEWDIRDPYIYQNLVNMANTLGSSPEYTIVAIKSGNLVNQQVGPLLTTQWHQGSPFNDLCPLGLDAGCAAIAAAQIMKYYRQPANLSLNGHVINWDNMPDVDIEYDNTPFSTHYSTPALVRIIGLEFNMNYTPLVGSWAIPGNVADGLRVLGYNVWRADHLYSDVKNELFSYRPVLMLGFDGLAGHYWVCDGVKESEIDTQFFVEFPTGGGYSNLGSYTPSNPGHVYESSVYCYMNWGWKSNKNGWFMGNLVNPQGHNYSNGRHNFYISR